MTYQSQVRLMMGQPQVAVEMLRQAVAKEPTFLQAYIYLSYAYLGLGQQGEAKAAIEAAKRQYPAQSAWLETGFAEMKADIDKFGPPFPKGGADAHGSTGPNTHGAGRAGHSDPRPASGSSVAGQLELDASLEGKLPAGAVVFVTIREAGSAGGPPVAAKRLPASFPCAFEVGQADSMQGGPLPERLSVEARIDADGDASTREPSDPVARLDDVRAGTTGIRLVLARR
jgi:tetratricopeptide (TPR) repeat protein